MRKLLCFLGFYKYKKTTRSFSIDGSIKDYYKCIFCGKKMKYTHNLNARHACVCGKEEGTCGCNNC
jgi:hypothetical protein